MAGFARNTVHVESGAGHWGGVENLNVSLVVCSPMDSPYRSSCSGSGLGHIREGGWERGLQLDSGVQGLEGFIIQKVSTELRGTGLMLLI